MAGLLDAYPGLSAGGNIDLNQLVRPPDPLGAALGEISQRLAVAGQASRLPTSTLGAIGSALGGANTAARAEQTQYIDQAIKLQALKRSLQQMGITQQAMDYVLKQWAQAGGGGAPGVPAAPLGGGGQQTVPGSATPAPGAPAVTTGMPINGPGTLPDVPNYSGAFGPAAAPPAAGLGGGSDAYYGEPSVQPLAPAAGPVLTQKQQYDADVAAGRRPIFPPGQRFNSRGEAISNDLRPILPGASFPASVKTTGLLGDGSTADASGLDTLVAQGGAGAATMPASFRLASLVGPAGDRVGAGDGSGAAADLVPGGGATAALRGLLAGSDSGGEDPLAGGLLGKSPDEVIPSGAPREDVQLASMTVPRSKENIVGAESGGNPNVGYGGVDLSNAPRDPETGFPQWAGRQGPAGISHAAGKYQFQPGTWAEGARALGINDFSEKSQDAVYDWTRAKYGDAPWRASEGGGLPIVKAQYAPGGGGAPAGSGAAAVEGMLGSAPALVGPGSGTIPGLGMTPAQVALLNTMFTLGGTNSPLKEFLDVYYKSPEYLRQAGQETAAGQRAVTEPSDIRIAQAKAVEDRVSKQLEQVGNARLSLAPNGILVPDGQGGMKRVQATVEQAVRAANGLPVPELGIAGMYPDTRGGTTAAGQPTRSQGPIAGEQVQTPAQAARDKAAQADFDTNVAAPFQAGQKALFPLTQIETAMQNYQTGGTTPETELGIKKALNFFADRLGLPADSTLRPDPNSVASGEIIRKSGNALGFELARSLGAHEAENVVNQAIQSNPGLSVSPTGNTTLIALIKQGIQRDFDKHAFYNQWFDKRLPGAPGGTYVGADDAFNEQHPVESYVSQVLPYKANTKVEADKLPPGTRFIGPDNNVHIRGAN